RNVRGTGFRLDDDGLEVRKGARFLNLLLQVFDGQIHAVGDLRQQTLYLIDVVAQQQHAERRIVVDKNAPFAIEHGAARRDHRHGANAILFSKLIVAIGLDDLQLPETEQQQTHQE